MLVEAWERMKRTSSMGDPNQGEGMMRIPAS
jgi:hypothetical protein